MVARALLEGEGPELAAAASPEPLELVQAGAVPAEQCQLGACVICQGVHCKDWILPTEFGDTLGIVEA